MFYKNVLLCFSERELSGSADPEAQHSQQHVPAWDWTTLPQPSGAEHHTTVRVEFQMKWYKNFTVQVRRAFFLLLSFFLVQNLSHLCCNRKKASRASCFEELHQNRIFLTLSWIIWTPISYGISLACCGSGSDFRCLLTPGFGSGISYFQIADLESNPYFLRA